MIFVEFRCAMHISTNITTGKNNMVERVNLFLFQNRYSRENVSDTCF